jgi:hypothetical protein
MKTISFGDCKEYGIQEIDLACGSDYSGCSVTKTNYKFLKKELNNYKGVYDLIGWFFGYGIGYDGKQLTKRGKEKIAEILDRLDNYPSLDDDSLSEFEYTEILEQFEQDYHYGLGKYKNDEDEIPENVIESCKEIMVDNIGNFAFLETGCIVYIDWKKIIEEFESRTI